MLTLTVARCTYDRFSLEIGGIPVFLLFVDSCSRYLTVLNLLSGYTLLAWTHLLVLLLTTVQYKLHLNEAVHTIPTVGFNVERVEYKKMEMTIW